MVLLNILSLSLYQFSTKLAWSTRDVAELGRGRGGAAITVLQHHSIHSLPQCALCHSEAKESLCVSSVENVSDRPALSQ